MRSRCPLLKTTLPVKSEPSHATTKNENVGALKKKRNGDLLMGDYFDHVITFFRRELLVVSQ